MHGYIARGTRARAGVRNRSEVLILSIRSVLPDNESTTTQLLFTVMPYTQVIPKTTLPEIYKVLTWSLRACAKGFHPEQDHLGRAWPPGSTRLQLSGTPLFNGWTMQFTQFESDWKFAQGLAMPERTHVLAPVCRWNSLELTHALGTLQVRRRLRPSRSVAGPT